MWYEQTPASYAESLRWSADRSDESAKKQWAEAKGTEYSKPQPFMEGEARYSERQSRRLRAMALLCDRSDAPTAGDMNFLGLHSPAIPRESEDFIVLQIEAGAVLAAA